MSVILSKDPTTTAGRILEFSAPRHTAALVVVSGNKFVLTKVPGHDLIKPIKLLVEASDAGFIASFVEANINTSGDSEWEAVYNISFLVGDLFDLLTQNKAELGIGPRRQLKTLRTYIR